MRVLFDMGGVTGGSPEPSFDASFTQWPPKSTATTYWFGPAGTLTTRAPNSTGADTYTYDPTALPATSAARSAGRLVERHQPEVRVDAAARR